MVATRSTRSGNAGAQSSSKPPTKGKQKRDPNDDAKNEEPPLKQTKLDSLASDKESKQHSQDEEAEDPGKKTNASDDKAVAKEENAHLLDQVDDKELEEAASTLESKEQVISHGRIYFLYKPKVAVEAAHSIDDVSRLHLILKPETPEDDRLKLIIVGRKYLPDADHSRQPIWAFVKESTENNEEVLEHLKRSSYSTKTQGERTVSEDRVFGEGHYALVVNQGDVPSRTSSHLVYVLELPDQPGDVQEAFNLKAEGSFGVSIKNPTTGNPPGGGLRMKDKPEFPKKLLDKFEGRRWNVINDADFLNIPNAELLLVSQKEDIPSAIEDELHTLAADDAEHTSKARGVASARIFEDLRAKVSKKDVNAKAVSGDWA